MFDEFNGIAIVHRLSHGQRGGYSGGAENAFCALANILPNTLRQLIRFPFIGVRENDKKPLTRILVKNIDDTYCFFYNFDDDREDSFAGFMRKHLVYLLEVINFEHNGRQGMLITFCARYLSLENFYVISWRTNAGD